MGLRGTPAASARLQKRVAQAKPGIGGSIEASPMTNAAFVSPDWDSDRIRAARDVSGIDATRLGFTLSYKQEAMVNRERVNDSAPELLPAGFRARKCVFWRKNGL
jgi:hypothetical protein